MIALPNTPESHELPLQELQAGIEVLKNLSIPAAVRAKLISQLEVRIKALDALHAPYSSTYDDDDAVPAPDPGHGPWP
eukprot:2980864-Karenia_brevis.AAC.1